MNFTPKKPVGCGIGLRPKHYPQILDKWPKIDWFEAISENFLDSGGRPIHALEQVRTRYPVALHGVALSIGSVDPLDSSYLNKLKALVKRIDPFLVSDHLCWSGAENSPLHDLLPLPFNQESLDHIVSRVSQVQEILGQPILLENVSSYVTYKHSEMTEWEFITEVAKRSGCGILLDVNNVYVNAVNHKFHASDYIRYIPTHLIGQIHLAGHTDMGEFLFDTHSAPIIDPVWKLYEETLSLHGQISTLIEWDENIPSLERLLAEADSARKIYDRHKKSSATTSKDAALSVSSVAHSSGNLKVSLFEVESKIRKRILPNHSHDSEFQFLNPQGSASGTERMEVYANGYPARMLEALKETYETIHRVLGDDTFTDLSHAYIQKFPSRHYNLNYAGQYLPEFLKALPEHIASKFPFLSDLSVLEWKCWQAFHAFDQKPFEASALAGIPLEEWERAKLTFQPSVSLIATEWPVFDLWKMKSAENFEWNLTALNNRPQKILIGRRGDLVRCEPLDHAQYQLIQNLLNGETLGSACEHLAEQDFDVDNLPIGNWFSVWIQTGLISDCHLTSPQPH